MNRWASELIIGGVVVPLTARIDGWSQTYEEVPGGSAVLRMADGSARKQTRWARLATSISAEGSTPPGLAGVDFSGTVTLACAAPRDMAGTGLAYTLPAARRTDTGFTPRGFALVGGQWQETALALVGNVATLTAVTGAAGYRVLWWPLLTVVCERAPTGELDGNAGAYRWQWSAEEA